MNGHQYTTTTTSTTRTTMDHLRRRPSSFYRIQHSTSYASYYPNEEFDSLYDPQESFDSFYRPHGGANPNDHHSTKYPHRIINREMLERHLDWSNRDHPTGLISSNDSYGISLLTPTFISLATSCLPYPSCLISRPVMGAFPRQLMLMMGCIWVA